MPECTCDTTVAGNTCDECVASVAIAASQDGHVEPALPTSMCLAACSKQGSRRDMRRCTSCMIEYHEGCVGIEGMELETWVCPLCAQQPRLALITSKATQQLVDLVKSLTTTVGEMKTELGELKTENAALRVQVRDVSDSVAGLRTENGELRGMVRDVGDSVAGLRARLEVVQPPAPPPPPTATSAAGTIACLERAASWCSDDGDHRHFEGAYAEEEAPFAASHFLPRS